MFIMRSHSYIDRPQLVLPPKLIEYIIDYLHDSPSALCACACICQDWVAPGHFHLFYYCKITSINTITPVPYKYANYFNSCKDLLISHITSASSIFQCNTAPCCRCGIQIGPKWMPLCPTCQACSHSYENWSLPESPLPAWFLIQGPRSMHCLLSHFWLTRLESSKSQNSSVSLLFSAPLWSVSPYC